MQFPNNNQVALVYERGVAEFDQIVAACARLLEVTYGKPFNPIERKPDTFARLFGGDELMVTIEHVDGPPNPAVFAQPLGSAVTGLLCPDIRQRLARARAMILINVSHGVLGDEIHDQFAAMFASIGMAREGANLPQFRRRLKMLANLSRLAAEDSHPSVVHWTQSNQLFPGERWDALAEPEAPSLIHLHPYLFGPREPASGKPLLGIRTFGARHFIGHELLLQPHEIDWSENLEAMLAFMRVALAEGGYLIPDGDSFGPEDGSLSYRVHHRPAEEGDVPVIELVPLLHRGAGFVSPDYVPRERTIDDRMPPAAVMPADEEAKAELANEWREKRKLAEGIGGRFEVRARGDAPLPPPSPPRPGVLGGRAVFGRKKA